MKKEKKLKCLLIALSATVVVLLGALLCVLIAKWRFPPEMSINGCDVGTMSESQARKTLYDYILADDITIKWNEEEHIPLSSLDCSIEVSPDICRFFTGNQTLLWIPLFQQSINKNVSVRLKPDKKKLREAIGGLKCVNPVYTTEPKNAEIVKKDGKYVIKKDIPGTRVDKEKLFNYILNSLDSGITDIDLSESGAYVTADIRATSHQLKQIIDLAHKFEKTSIEIDFDGANEIIDWNVLTKWVDYQNDTLILNHSALMNYLKSLADKYDTLKHQRDFVTHSGKTVKVGTDMDNYGFLLNRDETFNKILFNIDNFKKEKVEAVWEQKGLTRDKMNDFGDTYIEVSIDEQHLWYKRNGKVVFDTDVVTGMDSVERRRTPKGVFNILDIMKDHTMTGSYGSAYCHYCLAATWEGICIHDATWRDEFGGEIYKDYGSHGCINLPLDKMEELFNSEGITYGVPIIVY